MSRQKDTFCRALLQKVIHNENTAKGSAKGQTSCGTYRQKDLLQTAKGGVVPLTYYYMEMHLLHFLCNRRGFAKGHPKC